MHDVEDLVAWRQALHAAPELAFSVHKTSSFVASKLRSFGLDVVEGVAGTGVVATLEGSLGEGRSIALRADMDALPVEEANSFSHASTAKGCMHACGHDGHTTILLGAARQVARNPDFFGAIHFIVQRQLR